MDSGCSCLESLPADAFAMICSLVDDLSLPRLLLLATGTQTLLNKLASSYFYYSYRETGHYGHSRSVKSMFFRFPLQNLVSVRIDAPPPRSGEYPPIFDFDLLCALPRTLKELSLECLSSLESFLVSIPSSDFKSPFLQDTTLGGMTKMINLGTMFPQLSLLRFGTGTIWGKRVWSLVMQILFLGALPPSLIHLSIPSLSISGGIPVLKHIHCKLVEYLDVMDGDGVEKFSALKTLNCWRISSSCCENLPYDLTNLTASNIVDPFDASKLPKSLVKLKIANAVVSHPKDNESDSTPKSPPHIYDFLPPNIKDLSLHVGSFRSDMSTKIVKLSLDCSESPSDFSFLPQKLEYFKICASKGIANQGNSIDFGTLPRCLKSLNMSIKGRWSIKNAEKIPQELYTLELRLNDSKNFGTLVSSLSALRMSSLRLECEVTMDYNVLRGLPTSLRRLHLETKEKISLHLIVHLFETLSYLHAFIEFPQEQITDEMRATIDTKTRDDKILSAFLKSLPPHLRPGFSGRVSPRF